MRAQARSFARVLAMLAFIAVVAPPAFGAATITIVNNDGVGEGFNDPTPTVPVGGNAGATRGAQRLNVFQQAAAVWGALLTSAVEIRVDAAFNPLTCTPTGAVLGSAGPRSIHADFLGAEVAGHWYHQALANKLNGSDLSASSDINAQFNSDLDNATCLGTRSWYYGFDGNEGTDVDLFPVVLHELGHGLGFSTTTSSSSGNFSSGLPGIWDKFLFDTQTGLHWDQMTLASQRQASAINTFRLVWNGPAVRSQVAATLGARPEVVVNSPPGISGSLISTGAAFGGVLTTLGITGDVVLVDDGIVGGTGGSVSDGCETPFVNAAAVAGKIALIDRGLCNFTVKAANAQAAGAIAVIVANNAGSTPPTLGGADPSVTIPVVGIRLADANAIKANLLAGVNVTVRSNPALYAGANSEARTFMYAPNPVESGSSVSHFDVTAFPNLLMEPAINSDLPPGGVDLTRYLFEDIGWFAHVNAAPVASGPRVELTASPNPTRRTSTIQFTLDRSSDVVVSVHDVAGRTVKKLLATSLSAGRHSAQWDGTDAEGRTASAGVYLVRVATGSQTESKLLVLAE